MPALVKSSVGSFAGKSGLERTRIWPCRSKYCRNFSRISLPVSMNQKFSMYVGEIHTVGDATAARNAGSADVHVRMRRRRKQSWQRNTFAVRAQCGPVGPRSQDSVELRAQR